MPVTIVDQPSRTRARDTISADRFDQIQLERRPGIIDLDVVNAANSLIGRPVEIEHQTGVKTRGVLRSVRNSEEINWQPYGSGAISTFHLSQVKSISRVLDNALIGRPVELTIARGFALIGTLVSLDSNLMGVYPKDGGAIFSIAVDQLKDIVVRDDIPSSPLPEFMKLA